MDCTSQLSGDDLSTIALRNADRVLRCGTADLKGLSFFDAQLPVLSMNKDFRVEKHLKALSGFKSHFPKKEVAEAYGLPLVKTKAKPTDAEEELLASKQRGQALLMVGSKRLRANFEIPDYKFEYMGKAGGR